MSAGHLADVDIIGRCRYNLIISTSAKSTSSQYSPFNHTAFMLISRNFCLEKVTLKLHLRYIIFTMNILFLTECGLVVKKF